MYKINEVIENRYEVKNILMGGMGFVYISFDKSSEKLIAIKTIQDQFSQSLSGLERFVREAGTWITLGQHPNIVFAEKIQLIAGRPYIFMEYIPGDKSYGSSLRGRILQKNIDFEFALDIMIQLCNGLSYAQGKVPGMVHRDLKPENILITPDNVVKISDFGLVGGLQDEISQIIPEDQTLEFFQTNLTRSGRIVGTPPYMSPEQCAGNPIDITSDIYALGCIFYELLTGQWLLNSNNSRIWIDWHLNKTPTKPSLIFPQIPSMVDRVVLRCLQKEARNRYSDFDEMKKELLKIYRDIFRKTYISEKSQNSNVYPSEIDIINSFWAISDYEKVLKTANEALEKDLRNVNILAAKGGALAARNKEDDALDCLNFALQLDANCFRAMINISVIEINRGALDPAISHLNNALQLDPKSWQAWNNLGIAYENKGDIEKALHCYDKSIELTPWQSQAWNNKARVYKESGKRELSKACFKNAFNFAISYHDRASTIFNLLGESEYQNEEFYAAAINSLSRDNFKNDLDDVSSTAFMRDNLPHMGKYINDAFPVTGRSSYSRLVASILLVSDLVMLKKSRGEKWGILVDTYLMKIDDWGKVNKPTNSGVALTKAVSALYFLFAVTFFAKDEYEIASKIIWEALKRNPSDDVCRLVYGMCLFHLNKWEESILYLVDVSEQTLSVVDMTVEELNNAIKTIQNSQRM